MHDSLSIASEESSAGREWQNNLQHLLDVRDLCEEYNKSLGSRSSEISGIWSTSLFLRLIATLNAVMVLIKFRLNDDAAIIIRTMFEIELQLGAIKEQPEFSTQLVQRTEAHRRNRLEAFIESRREMPEGITKEAMAEQIAQISAAGIPADITKRQLAKKAGLLYEFQTLYSLLSDIAHVSPMGLAYYLEKDAISGKIRLNPNGSLLSPEYLIGLAGATQLNILDLVGSILGDAPPPKAEELRRQNGAILHRIKTEARI
jgi:hypothetical protein